MNFYIKKAKRLPDWIGRFSEPPWLLIAHYGDKKRIVGWDISYNIIKNDLLCASLIEAGILYKFKLDDTRKYYSWQEGGEFWGKLLK